MSTAKRNKWIGFGTGLALIAVAGLILSGQGQGGVAAPQVVPEKPASMVSTEAARAMDFVEAVSSDGTINARFYSLVSPRINGVIDGIYVREGDQVAEGDTVLFQIDNQKLRQSVDFSAQALVIAKSTLEERRAGLESTEADLAQGEKDFARIERLYQQKVTHLSDYEQSETKLVQLRAAKKLAAAQVALAEQSVDQAEISLAMAEQDLSDSIMRAPISGVVSGRFSEPGEMGSPGNAILRVEDTANLKAIAYLPGQYYHRIKPGTSNVELSVHGNVVGRFPVTYKSPAIDSALRTFEIWAEVPGDGEFVVPGAQCHVKVILDEANGVGVPRDAIQYRKGKYWVFVPEGDVARMVEVTPGREKDGWTELRATSLVAGGKVVTQGQFLLSDGSRIRERQ